MKPRQECTVPILGSIEEAASHFIEELFRYFRHDQPDVIVEEAQELVGGRRYE